MVITAVLTGVVTVGLTVLAPQSAPAPASAPAQRSALASRTWTVGGVERTALVYLPPETTKPAPLVFVFHGHGGMARVVARGFHIHELWPEAIVVYPQGLPTPGALTDPEGKRAGWQNRPGVQGDRDLQFFDTMLAAIEKERVVDKTRIYATGHSNGGGFTYLLAVARPGTFAAIAPSSSLAAAGRVRGAQAPRPIPVLHVAGRNDPLVKFAWQERTMSAVRTLNGCQGAGKTWENVKEATVYDSPTGTPVVTYIHDGDHKFPTEAPALIVRFFKQHPATATTK